MPRRSIDTKMWGDNWFSGLDPTERYLFLYFLTNEHTSLCGIYEIPLRIMAFETGLDMEMLNKIILRFSEDGKIHYQDGWVCVVNYEEYQIMNPSMKSSADKSLHSVPPSVLYWFRAKNHLVDTLSTSCGHNKDKDKDKDKDKNLCSSATRTNEQFTEFWFAYPRKQAKQDAEKAFRAAKLKPEQLQTILQDIQRRRASADWMKDGGQFIPLPATYLRGKRWEDSPSLSIVKPNPFAGVI